MRLFLLLIYILFICAIWGFFIVAKIHAYKFKNFSEYISKITPILAILLMVLTITGGIIIIFMDSPKISLLESPKSEYNYQSNDYY